MITEDQLEQLSLTWFQAIGHETVCGYDIAPDGDSPVRSDYRQIVIFDRLLAKLQEIRDTGHSKHLYSDLNISINKEELEEAI